MTRLNEIAWTAVTVPTLDAIADRVGDRVARILVADPQVFQWQQFVCIEQDEMYLLCLGPELLAAATALWPRARVQAPPRVH